MKIRRLQGLTLLLHPPGLALFPLSKARAKIKRSLVWAAVVSALLTMVVDVSVILRLDPSTPAGGDAPYFYGLAKSLAQNHGYRLERSFWPNAPNAERLPVWPALLSIPVRAFPLADENALLRFTGAAVHALSSAVMVGLAFQISGTVFISLLMGLGWAVYVPAIALVELGASESLFVLLAICGTILVFEGGYASYWGTLLWGLAALVRVPFTVLPFFILLLLALLWRRVLKNTSNLAIMGIGSFIFALFPGFWLARNYVVFHRFPAFTSLEGETFYGGNNELVASDLEEWGYWVFPNRIPGEQTKQELARTRTQFGLNDYYRDKGLAFIRNNRSAMPRLILGKLIRGFVPLPWKPLATSYVGFFMRFCLYLAFLFSLMSRPIHRPAYACLLGAIFLVTVTVTTVYWGNFRFTFCIDPFLFPVVAVGLSNRFFTGVKAPAFAYSSFS